MLQMMVLLIVNLLEHKSAFEGYVHSHPVRSEKELTKNEVNTEESFKVQNSPLQSQIKEAEHINVTKSHKKHSN